MQKTTKFTVLFVLLFNSFTVAAKTLDIVTLHLRLGMNGDFVESEDVKARVFGVGLGLFAEEKIDNNLILFLDINSSLETGSNDSVGTSAEFEPTENVNLNSAGLRYNISSLEFQFGALNLGQYNSPLLVTSTPFVAASQQWGKKLYLKAIQAIPSNNKLTRRIGSVDSGNPVFVMETIGLNLGESFKFNLEASHFAFSNLSSEVAKVSKEFGNSVSGIGEASEFNYGFKGYNVYSQVSYSSDDSYEIGLAGQYLINNDAPEKRNKAFLARPFLKLGDLRIELEAFESQTDASPAFYNSKYYGHNNVKGNSLKLGWDNGIVQSSVKYIKSEIIESNLVQNDTEIVVFNLEREYEI